MHPPRRGTLRLLGALMVGSLVVPAALFAYTSWNSWHTTQALTDDRIARTLDVLHEHASKVLTTGNLVLDDFVDGLVGFRPTDFEARALQLQARLKRTADLLPQVRSIAIVDRAGRTVVASDPSAIPEQDVLREREFFRTHVVRDAGIHVGPLVPADTAAATPTFTLSRRLTAPDGSFDGVVMVSMLPSDFEKFYGDLARGAREVFALLREDGAFLARYPVLDRIGAAPPIATPVAADLERNRRGLLTAAGIDGVERRYGWRHVDGFPVYVTTGVATASIRAEWLSTIATHLVFGLPATLALFAILHLARRRTAGLYAEVDRREEVETALRQAQRLEAVGRLTGGVAHDFNNLLMVISGSAARLRATMSGDKNARLVEMILTAAKRGETLTRHLLSFSRQQALSPQGIDVARRMHDLHDLIERSLADDVEVVIDTPPTPCPVKVDPGEFEVAVLNICVNARDAMPNGGRLVVSVRETTLDREDEIDDLVGDYVVLAFSDTGCGIAPELLPRVFDPFVTTKDAAKGTGLGLSQVYGFAKQAGGAATIESTLGRGTTVTLHLPRAPLSELAAPARTETRGAPTVDPARKTVLVVEDNLPVAEVCRSYLAQLGYGVEYAASPHDGLMVLKSRDRVDVILSDILMPGGMSGLDFAREVRTLRPSMPVILMTGFSNSAEAVAHDGFPVLRKPFDLDALERELSAAVAAHASEKNAGHEVRPAE